MFLKSLVMLVALIVPTTVAAPASWPGRIRVDDTVAVVRFEVDSTWHLIEGTTSGIDGLLTVAPDGRVRGEISIPVAAFDTDSDSRDERLREVMTSDKFPKVSMLLDDAQLGCTPAAAEAPEGCSGELSARLTIRDVTKEIRFPYSVSRGDKGFVVKGDFSLEWAEYGVEDPSILVAHLDPTVKVSFELRIS